MNNRSKQHENLQKASQARHDANVQLMTRVLAYIAQTHRPPPANCYTPKNLLSVAQFLQPGTTLHRSTLSNNLTIARMIEQALAAAVPPASPTPAKRRRKRKRRQPVQKAVSEGESKHPKRPKPAQKRHNLPDFAEVLTWCPPKRLSPEWERHRRETLFKHTKKDIAVHIVRLTNIRDYTDMRLAAIEPAEWVSGPWPEHHHYPCDPMQYDPTDDAHFASLLTRRKLKGDLIDELIKLETETLGPFLRLEAYDTRYFQPRIQEAQARIRKRPCRTRKNCYSDIKKRWD